MKNITILIAITLLLSNTSCIKYRTKYQCESNCTPVTINLNVVNKSNLNLLAKTKFEIVLMDNLPGSAQNIRIMGTGTSDDNGNFSTTVICDTSLLNSANYYIKINYKWDVNTIQVCYDNTSSFLLENYPVSGIFNINIESYRKWNSPLDFVKKSNEKIKTAYVIFDKACNYNQTDLHTTNDTTKRIDARTYLNCMNYITIVTVDTLNIPHEINDSVYIDNNFSGKTFEY